MSRPMSRWVWALVLFGVLAGPAYAASRLAEDTCVKQTSPYLRSCGGTLYLDKKAYREIGLNFYKLFSWYLEDAFFGTPRAGRTRARRALRDLHTRDFRVVRVMIAPYAPAYFQETFFDADPIQERVKRQKFFSALDAMIGDCRREQIQIVASLVWNLENLADLGGHSLREGARNFQSSGYRKIEEFVRLVTDRYKNEPAIILWEIGNEWNLLADLQLVDGVMPGPEKSDLHAPSRYRGPENNLTSLEVARLFEKLAVVIRANDKNHLITSGMSEPRPSAMHLYRAAMENVSPDWSVDSVEEHVAYIAWMHQAVDVISLHDYANEAPVSWYQHIAQKLAKPLLVSELGPRFVAGTSPLQGADYTDPAVIADMENKFLHIVASGIPISLLWTYDCSLQGDLAFMLCPGRTDRVLDSARQAARRLKKRR